MDMPIIETAVWTPPSDNQGRRAYAGQRTAQEVFNDLEAHLRSVGYLPDEYFLFDRKWDDGRLFPEDGWLTCQVDYGGSEGIYLDVTLEYDEGSDHKYEHFATGKTLDESGSAMDRMHLIASAVIRAFHEDGLHARFFVAGCEPAPEGCIVHLSAEECRLVLDALAKFQDSLVPMDPQFPLATQLIRRIGDGGRNGGNSA